MTTTAYFARPTTMSAALSPVTGRAAVFKMEPKAMLVRKDGKRQVLAA
jgi:hypothetical protein